MSVGWHDPTLFADFVLMPWRFRAYRSLPDRCCSKRRACRAARDLARKTNFAHLLSIIYSYHAETNYSAFVSFRGDFGRHKPGNRILASPYAARSAQSPRAPAPGMRTKPNPASAAPNQAATSN